MKDRVTPETAKLLKKAGYPQPVLECGQVWCIDESFDLVYVVGIDNIGVFNLRLWCKYDVNQAHFVKNYAYAPTFLELATAIGGSIEFTEDWVKVRGHIANITESTDYRMPCELLATIWLRKKMKMQPTGRVRIAWYVKADPKIKGNGDWFGEEETERLKVVCAIQNEQWPAHHHTLEIEVK